MRGRKKGRLKYRLWNKWRKLSNFYKLYTSGLNRHEIERFLQKDAQGAISYLKSKTELEDVPQEKRTPRSFVHVVRELFLSFIMQLTPARRLVYGIGVLIFILALFQKSTVNLIVSFVLINFLLLLELVDKLTTRDELEIAREIQMSLQPARIPKFRMLSVAAFSQPARVVGGDFFDIVQPGPDGVMMIIGDVSGKGISAALYAASMQSMFLSLSESSTSPAKILSSLNHLISGRLRDGDFVTVAAAYFDLNEKTVTVARAGHNWPLHYSTGARRVSEIRPRGLSIGVTGNDMFASLLEEQTLQLTPGDFLLFYSDGITEASNAKNDMFNIEGLKTAISDNAASSSEALINLINTRVHDFVKPEELHDDATLLAIKIE